MGVTAILVATGRIERLNEAIASFLDQDLEDKQLIVFNSCFRQTLSGDFPNVIFINAKEMTMPMRCKNISIENAKHPIIVLWSEIDYYLPGHLSRVVKNMEGRDWCWFEREFQSDHRRHLRVEQGSESVFSFSRTAWRKVGGFHPGINGADDRNFIARVTGECEGQKIPTSPAEITFIRVGNEEARAACKPTIKSGPIKVEPLLSRDYRSQILQFLSGKIENKVCVVELGRFGDLINILPYLRMIHELYDTPAVCVSQEFVSLFDGISYVKPWPLPIKNEELGQALSLAKEEFSIVINAQIWGRGWSQRRTTESYNKESWANCGILNLFEDKEIRPAFDRRDPAREAQLIKTVLTSDVDSLVSPGITEPLLVASRPVILVNTSKAISSPCPTCDVVLDEIRKLWGVDNIVVDLAKVTAERIYDLLGLFEISSCLVCIDSAFLHLAQAVDIGIVAITNPKPWAGTIVRRNLVAQTDYEKLDMAKIHEGIAACLNIGPLRIKTPEILKPLLYRAFNLIDKFEDSDEMAIRRKSHAVKSQDDLYENGRLTPIHVWDYPRTADKELGDPRRLPYLKDLFQKFLDVSENANDVCIWSNDDTILHPNIVEYAKFHCAVYGACSFFRSEFGPNPPSLESRPEDYARQSRGRHIGRDAFAFSRSWLHENWDDIPDFVLGASGWDLCMAAIIRLTFGIKTTGANLGEQIFPAEPPNGYVGHIAHKSLWNLEHTVNSPSNVWNGKLFRKWSEKNDMALQFTPENNLA